MYWLNNIYWIWELHTVTVQEIEFVPVTCNAIQMCDKTKNPSTLKWVLNRTLNSTDFSPILRGHGLERETPTQSTPSTNHKWNMRERVLNSLLTTNNSGFHKKFSTIVGHRNPSVWTWLDAVRANQNLSFNALFRHAGNLPGPLPDDTVIARQRQTKTAKRCFEQHPCLNI